MASGDRDFNQVLNALRARNKTVIVWGVRGSTSRQLENNPGVTIEYVEDFTKLQTHQSLSTVSFADNGQDTTGFTPSQWSSVIVQFDRVANSVGSEVLPMNQLLDQLQEVGAVISQPRGEDLISQAMSLGILKAVNTGGDLMLNPAHPVVEKTRLIRDRVVVRVLNTLTVRGWEYVNYGFLLKGLAMDRDLQKDFHPPATTLPFVAPGPDDEQQAGPNWAGISLNDLEQLNPDTANMVRRIVVSVEQFTSFRNFTWCPLGSLHRRLRTYDTGMAFQRAVEYLKENDAAEVSEYSNPQSDFLTKGISLDLDAEISQSILVQRDAFIRILLLLYERNILISDQSVRATDPDTNWNFDLWFSVMETENVLNAVPGRPGQYSLFRTHHTVNLVADAQRTE
jgi:hypothetical protein